MKATRKSDIARVRSSYERSKDYRWTYSSIFQAYGRPSSAKISAWEHCERLRDEFNGTNLRVLSRNTFMFTAGFEFEDENGVINYMLITPTVEMYAEV